MSKKGMTTGEEFEDFLKFAMKYRPSIKEHLKQHKLWQEKN